MTKKMLQRFGLSVILLTACISSHAQDDQYQYASHHISFSQIEKEWENQYVYSAGDAAGPDIKAYFLGFVHTYPNDLLQRMSDKLFGYRMEGILTDYVCDTQNGYIGAKFGVELDAAFQMCYWRCSDGSTVIGVAIEGDEYTEHRNCENENDDEPSTASINAMMFYKVDKGVSRWTPCPVKELCGRQFNFADYHIQLPRQGKDITLTHKEKAAKNVVLKWNGSRFAVSR